MSSHVSTVFTLGRAWVLSPDARAAGANRAAPSWSTARARPLSFGVGGGAACAFKSPDRAQNGAGSVRRTSGGVAV